jgi:divalent metal cation (Fe/Co/Zn/Cd) transporter
MTASASSTKGGALVPFHALRTRQSGSRAFLYVHVLVPGAWTGQGGHDVIEHVEAALRVELPDATVFTHLEPAEDPRSFETPRWTATTPRPPGNADPRRVGGDRLVAGR